MRLFARMAVFSSCLAVGAVAFLAAQQAPPATPPTAPPAAGQAGAPPGGGRAAIPLENIKVLPKNWTRQQVQAVMNTFVVSLGQQAPAQGAPAPAAGQGEGCLHCHVRGTEPGPGGRGPQTNYAADTNPNKDIARKMIEMVMSINNGTKDVGDKAVLEKVSCWSCHQGKSKPAVMPEAGWGRGGFSLLPPGPPMPPPPAGRGGN